jgi:hypothetical protein
MAAISTGVDVLGNANDAFAPHIITLGYELLAGGQPTPIATDMAKIYAELFRFGVRTQVKQVANTVAVTIVSVDAVSAVTLDLDADILNLNRGV